MRFCCGQLSSLAISSQKHLQKKNSCIFFKEIFFLEMQAERRALGLKNSQRTTYKDQHNKDAIEGQKPEFSSGASFVWAVPKYDFNTRSAPVSKFRRHFYFNFILVTYKTWRQRAPVFIRSWKSDFILGKNQSFKFFFLKIMLLSDFQDI